MVCQTCGVGSFPGSSVNLMSWLLGRCETSLLGSVRQAQDPTCTYSDEMSLLPGEGGPFRKASTIN